VELAVVFPETVAWTGFAAGSDALFGGARDAGVWRLPLDVLTGAEPPPAGPTTFVIGGPRPNPARAHVVVEATLSVAQRVRAEVLDATGRRVVVFHDGRLGPGMHRLGFDASALATGVYVVRVSGADVHRTRRLAVYR
jgi:hypothetical protein